MLGFEESQDVHGCVSVIALWKTCQQLAVAPTSLQAAVTGTWESQVKLQGLRLTPLNLLRSLYICAAEHNNEFSTQICMHTDAYEFMH